MSNGQEENIALNAVVQGVSEDAPDIIGQHLGNTLQGMRRDWLKSVSAGLLDLKCSKSDLPDLQIICKDEHFASAVLRISESVLTTRDQAKLFALRNAVLNIAYYPDRDLFERETLLHLLDRVTALHLRLIIAYRDYAKRLAELNNTMPLASEFPLLTEDLVPLATRDLVDWHLVKRPWRFHADGHEPTWTNMYGQLGINHVSVSSLGLKLVELVSDPLSTHGIT